MSNRAAPSATASIAIPKYLRGRKPVFETLSIKDNDIREPREPARQKNMGAKLCLEIEHCCAPPSASWQQRCLQPTHLQWRAGKRTGGPFADDRSHPWNEGEHNWRQNVRVRH